MRAKNAGGSLNVALASYDLAEIRVLKRYLEEQSADIKCTGYRSGTGLLADLHSGVKCDVIVIVSRLEDMEDGELLTRLRGAGPRPPLLLCGDNSRSADAVSCLRSDGRSYIIKHTDMNDLMQELCRISGRRSLRTESLCGGLYSDWGINRADTNCGYLTTALRIACGAGEKLALRKELLRQVGDEHHTSVEAVDSGIRRLIDTLEKRQAEGWRAFKQKTGLADKKPTTGRLIYAAREYLLAHDGI